MSTLNLLDLPKKSKFGYYQVGDLDFVSKISAIEQDHRTNQGVKWNFCDEIFGSYDWTREPTESLQELYRMRAQQIRDNYDYVVIWYSGGADSHNVLNSFLQHGIHVDEIATTHYAEADRDGNGYWTAEVEATALPDLQEIKKQFPETFINYADWTRYVPQIYQNESRHQWIYEHDGSVSPNNYLRGWIRELDPHYKRIIESGKRMVFVWGHDKPRIKLGQDGRYGVQFNDMINHVVSNRTQIVDRPWEHDELFYWTPGLVPLIIKQAHVLKRFLSSVQVPHPDLIATNDIKSNDYQDLGITVRNGIRYYLTRDGQASLIYPWWDRRWQRSKPIVGGVISARDSWFFNTNHNEFTARARSSFFNGLDKIAQIAGKRWLKPQVSARMEYWFDLGLLDQYRASNGLVGCPSPTYWLS